MQTLLHKLAVLIAAPLLALFASAGHAVPATHTGNLGATNPIESPVALFETSLASGITSSQTTMTLVSATTLDGSVLASSTYGFIIDQGTASQELVEADCTSTACTNMTRGISSLDGTTTVAALQFSHRRGASVKMTDAPLLIKLTRILNGIGTFPNTLSYTSAVTIATSSNNIPTAIWVSGAANTASTSVKSYADSTFLNRTSNSQTVSGNNTYSGVLTFSGTPVFSAGGTFNSVLPQSSVVPATGADLVNKTYADALAIAGAPNASLIAKGIIQIANNTQAASSTASGSTGALLVLPASMSTSTSQVATSSIVATLGNGKIDNSFIDATSTLASIFGNAQDGDVTIALGATTTLTRDMYYGNLTVNGALVTQNWRVFVKGTLAGSGSIKQDGSNGSAASAATAGAGAATTTGFFMQAGSTAGAGASGVAGAPSLAWPVTFDTTKSGVGGAGGAGNSSGGAGGTVGTNTSTSTIYGKGTLTSVFDALDISTTTSSTGYPAIFRIGVGSGASGGGAGGPGNGSNFGAGGGGGQTGGVVFVAANNFGGTMNLRANGGTGGVGGNGSQNNDGGGGGGGGGKGGVVIPIYGSSYTWSGSCTVSGGSGGAGGSPGSGGTTGSTGNSGGAGICLSAIDIRNLIR